MSHDEPVEPRERAGGRHRFDPSPREPFSLGAWTRTPRRSVLDPGRDPRPLLLWVLVGPCLAIGGLGGVVRGPGWLDRLEGLGALVVGGVASAALLLYLARPATLPRSPTLREEITRWLRGRRQRREEQG
ncbi:MAG: hypothetical protein ACTHN8_03360 [Angustibacter sp.]